MTYVTKTLVSNVRYQLFDLIGHKIQSLLLFCSYLTTKI